MGVKVFEFFMGDINCVRCPEERKNSEFCLTSANDFNNFITDTGLTEFKMGGSIFTYSSQVGNKHSKIDWVLVGHDFINRWPKTTLMALPKRYSDHRPLVLSCVDLNFGPCPFRFYNSCLRNDDLEEVIKKTVDQCNFLKQPDMNLANKLKRCKVAIKEWRKKKWNWRSRVV